MMVAFASVSWVIAVVVIGGLGIYLANRKRLAALAVFIILAILLLIRPVFFFLGLDSPYPYDQFDDDFYGLMAIANLMAVTWSVIFAGSYIFFHPAVDLISRYFPQAPRYPDIRVLGVIVVFTTLLGSLGTLLLINSNGGSVAEFTSAVKVEKQLAGFFIIRQVSIFAAVVCIYALLSVIQRSRQAPGNTNRSTQRLILLFFLAMIGFNLAINYSWGNRYNIALVLLVFVLSWHYYVRRLDLLRIIVLAVMVVASMQALKWLRLSMISELRGFNVVADQSFALNISTSLHLNQYDAFMLAIRDVGDVFPFRRGEDFVNGLVSWVPRSILPDRETHHIGGWFRQIYQPETVNGWPITVIGSWYINFGPLGVPIGAVISGLVAAAIDKAYRSPHLYPWHAVAGLIFGLFFLDGGFNTGLPQKLFLWGIPLYVLVLVLRFFSRRSLLGVRRRGLRT
jgi:oligosaccharide repeat unit polymerase